MMFMSLRATCQHNKNTSQSYKFKPSLLIRGYHPKTCELKTLENLNLGSHSKTPSAKEMQKMAVFGFQGQL